MRIVIIRFLILLGLLCPILASAGFQQQTIGAISFTPSKISVNGSAILKATASSKLTVSFTTSTPVFCSVKNITITGKKVGTCIIVAEQKGNSKYKAAPVVKRPIAIIKASLAKTQTIKFSAAPTIMVNKSGVVSATASSGLAVNFKTTTPLVCSLKGSSVTTIKLGTCTIAANQAGNANFKSAVPVTLYLVIGKINQTIKFGIAPTILTGGIGTISATATSGLAVNFSSITPSICIVKNNTVTGIKTGICSIAGNQTGNGNYKSALQEIQFIRIGFITKPMVSAGGNCSVALKADGTVVEWGYIFSHINYQSPEVVPELSNVVAVSAAKSLFSALKADGTVMLWGYEGSNDVLGIGANPVSVSGLTNITAVDVDNQDAGQGGFVIALKSDGTVMTWGMNDSGQLGDGTRVTQLTPVAVPGVTGVIAISGHFGGSMALKSDGTVITWGLPHSTGKGTEWLGSSPMLVPGLTDIIAVSSGGPHMLALKSDGTVVEWNFYYTPTPVIVPGLTGVISISASYNYSVALKSDHTVFAWGANNYGQLGNGTILTKKLPVAVSGLTDVINVSAGDTHVVALKSNGKMMAWGDNRNTALGLGAPNYSGPNNSTVPLEVGSYKPTPTCTSPQVLQNGVCVTPGAGGAAACSTQYTGPNNDPQVDSFCKLAAFDACLHRATGQATYDHEGQVACQTLSGLLSAIGATNTYSCGYCPYPY